MIKSITFVGTRGEASLTIIPAGPSGPAGASAYGVAVANGFIGSELEWLASLEGDRGKSAYEVAVANGFVGNEAAWLASLDGTDGDDGTNGWTPVHAIAADGERRVKQVVDWIGGTGTKPATGKYVGATGLVDDIGDATDERGAKGADGLGTGDMTKAVYDPQEIEADAFDRANHTGTQAAATITGLATVALTNQYADLAGKPSLGSAADKDATYFAPASHTHTVSQISDASANGRALVGAANYAAMRTLLGLVVGTDVQAYDVDTLKGNVADQTISGGARITVLDLGSKSSGTVTPDPGDRPHQKYTNTGAHTLAPGSNYGDYYLDIINGSGAGAITTTGWTKVSGDSFTTTNGHKFRCGCSVTADGSTLVVLALQ